MYTLWSRGRLIGQSTLGYERAAPGLLAGDFEPSPFGEKLMPVITGVGPALRCLYRVMDDVWPQVDEQADGHTPRGFPAAIRQTTEYADAVSLEHELDSLALELRGPDGAVVPTESIAVNDTEYLISLANAPDSVADLPLSPEVEEAIANDLAEIRAMRAMRKSWEDDDEESWKPEKPFARYQIIVVLEGGIHPD
ncbi:MAG TPA: hypothetical protein VFZ21_27525 [Gemmatimonadaceae bacterium]|jgi:hypothetical protein|nr:hypothetical protein [Gemmatimonadaceae bacterium]